MKTLLISNLYPPNALGGYERLCFSIAEALVARGHHVGVLTSSYGGLTENFTGQQVWRTLLLLATEGNIYQPFDTPQLRRDEINGYNINELNRIVTEFQPDVIFVWNLYFFDATLVHEIERNFGGKTVYFLTDNWLISFFNNNFLGQYFPRVVFGNESDQDVVTHGPTIPIRGSAIFGSTFMERFYANAGLGFADHEVIYNGVHLPAVDEVSYRDRLYPIRFGTLRLLFAGRVVDVKGVHTTLKALPLIAAALPSIKITLEIVGDCQDDAYRSLLAKIINENSLEDMVVFREPVPLNQLFSLFQEYDIYLFPSLYEPFALTLINALHAGIPTVASNVGGNPEIVFNEETGVLFRKNDAEDLANAVLKLYRQPLQRAHISRRARHVAWKYTFEKMIARIDRTLRGKLMQGK